MSTITIGKRTMDTEVFLSEAKTLSISPLQYREILIEEQTSVKSSSKGSERTDEEKQEFILAKKFGKVYSASISLISAKHFGEGRADEGQFKEHKTETDLMVTTLCKTIGLDREKAEMAWIKLKPQKEKKSKK